MAIIKAFLKKPQGKGAGGKGGIVCHNCGKPGHKSPDCRQGGKGGGGVGGIVCHNCGKPGHKSPDCRQGAKGGGGGGGIVCHTCGKPGHKSPDCRQGAKGSGGGGGKGGGKGKRRNVGILRQNGKTHPDKNVWFAGLAERDTHKDADLNKKLQAWMNKLCEGCKFVDIGPKGSGGAIFGSEEEASAAIATLNGKKFMGKTMEFDVWVQGFKGDEEE